MRPRDRPGPAAERLDAPGHPVPLGPLGRRRLANFKANRRGYVSLALFVVLFLLA